MFSPSNCDDVVNRNWNTSHIEEKCDRKGMIGSNHAVYLVLPVRGEVWGFVEKSAAAPDFGITARGSGDARRTAEEPEPGGGGAGDVGSRKHGAGRAGWDSCQGRSDPGWCTWVSYLCIYHSDAISVSHAALPPTFTQEEADIPTWDILKHCNEFTGYPRVACKTDVSWVARSGSVL